MLLALAAFVEQPLSAYADPGSGALLWQVLMAGLVGGLFYLRRIGRWFRNRN